MSPPKARKGDAIVCSKGHRVGHFLVDVPAGEPVPTDALSIAGPLIPDHRQGYVCGQCEEVVALLEDSARWRVRTARGWMIDGGPPRRLTFPRHDR